MLQPLPSPLREDGIRAPNSNEVISAEGPSHSNFAQVFVFVFTQSGNGLESQREHKNNFLKRGRGFQPKKREKKSITDKPHSHTPSDSLLHSYCYFGQLGFVLPDSGDTASCQFTKVTSLRDYDRSPGQRRVCLKSGFQR